MAWNQAAVTDKGLALLSEAVEKGGITITRAAGGETCCAASELTAQTEVSAPARHIDIARKERSGSVITVNLRISNTGAEQAFSVRQIGLYAAANGSEEEVLLALIQDERGEEIPSEAENPEYLLELDFAIPVSNAEKIEVDKSGGVFTTPDDVERIIGEKLASGWPYPTWKPLDDTSWEEIDLFARMGLAPLYWEIGDRKAVALSKGKLGAYDFSATTRYAAILGFNHDGNPGTIDFSGWFSSYEVPLTTPAYLGTFITDNSGSSVNGSKIGNMNHRGTSNFGGWAGCDLRYDILGSTDIPPNTYGAKAEAGREGYDATPNCAINPVPNTLMERLPEELRVLMQPMTIWADNVGGGTGRLAENVTPTIDYLPLIGYADLYRVVSTSMSTTENSYIGDHHTQYEYFKLGNTTMYTNASGDKWGYWTREVSIENSSNFRVIQYVTDSRTVVSKNASSNSYFFPVFRVGGAAA